MKRLEELVSVYRKHIQLIKSELSDNPKQYSKEELEKIVEMKFEYKILTQILEEYKVYKKELDVLKSEWTRYLRD